MQMKAYAADQAAALLRALVFRVNRAAKLPDPDAVHDIRVAARRLAQCLRTFRGLFPAGPAKKARRRLRKILSSAAEVRDRDVALRLCAEAGLSSDAQLVSELAKEREQASHALLVHLSRFRRRELSRKWRKRLRL